VVISCFIVSTMLVVALNMIGASARARLINREEAQGLTLAEQLLEEIRPCKYADPDTESGEARATWDDISDFNNLTESPPKDRGGVPLAGYEGWTRNVRVELADPANPGNNAGSDLGLKRITVTVTCPSGRVVTLTGLRSSKSAYERPLTVQRTYVSGIDVSLQVGPSAGGKASTSVSTLNQAP
jgi:hypothetical protein